jgi:hypothetical protein
MAREQMATLESIPSACSPFEHHLPDGSTATVTITKRNAPLLGDEAIAHLIEFDRPEAPTILRDVLIVRIGDVLVLTEGVDRVEDDPQADRQQDYLHDLTDQAVDKAIRILSD